MNFLSIFISSLALVVVSALTPPKKEKIEAFYKCLACGNTEGQAEFKKCKELQPKKTIEMAETCKVDIMAGIKDEASRWKHVCENPDAIGKIHDCVMTDENKKQITPEDIIQLGKFKDCSKEVNKKYCKIAE